MSFSYTPGGTDTVSQARFLLGDTISAGAELADEEITGIATLFPDSVLMIASNLCTALAAKYAASVQTSAAGVSSAMQQRHTQYKTMAAQYRQLALSGGAAVVTISPFVGGTESVTGRPPIFEIGMDDYPGLDLPPELLDNPYDAGEG